MTKYQQQLTANPLRTKMLTSIILWSSGDILCQAFIHRMANRNVAKSKLNNENSHSSETEPKKNDIDQNNGFMSIWNRDRTLRQGFIGGLLLGPSLHFFFTRIIPRVKFPRHSHGFNVFMRVVAQQTCTMPVF